MNHPITPGEILLEDYLVPMGISQNALARSAICRYERHPANLTLSTFEKVARATGRRLIVKFA